MGRTTVSAIKVNQWLPAWNEIDWQPDEYRSEPPKWFYIFSLTAYELRRLSGVYRRTSNRQTSIDDLGIQRQLDLSRSEEIRRFIEFGYPWSDLTDVKRKSNDYQDLRQPGWLPTAIIINILTSADTRLSKKVDGKDLVEIKDNNHKTATLTLPSGFSQPDWMPATIPPFEVIDGQHRLDAFNKPDDDTNFELPVVAFVGLDLSWQAYIFYTVNIKPKKINPSLAFDLYPLLRTEKWLEKLEGHSIYRETRAQELVDKLCYADDSPWHRRINMLGDRGLKGLMATQSAWVRTIMASYVKSWEGSGVRIGGLFGSKVGVNNTVLPWNLDQQGAFLIFVGNAVRSAIRRTEEPWALALRQQGNHAGSDLGDQAFFGQHNLLNQDQGIRTLLQVTNDLCYLNADQLELSDVFPKDQLLWTERGSIAEAIGKFADSPKLSTFISELSRELATYDWRASGFPRLTEEERTLKASFRGSGGYKQLRRDVLGHLKRSESRLVSATATEVYQLLGYDKNEEI